MDALSIDLDLEAVAQMQEAHDAEMGTPAVANRDRDDAMNGPGAETEVEYDGTVGLRGRRPRAGAGISDLPMSGAVVDLTEDDDAEMEDAEHDHEHEHEHEHPLPPLPEGSPIPADHEEARVWSRSGSVESGLAEPESGGSGGSGEGVESRVVVEEEGDRAVKRKR